MVPSGSGSGSDKKSVPILHTLEFARVLFFSPPLSMRAGVF